MSQNTLREMYNFNRWANDLILDAVSPMPDEQIDRRFEMGSGSLRETLKHIYAAERIWYERIGGPDPGTLPEPMVPKTLADVRAAGDRLADLRSRWFESLGEVDLARDVDFRDREGQPHTRKLSDILLHVCNHGVYHRAQAVNMIRSCGVKPPHPGPDYIFMKWNQPGDTRTPLDVPIIRRYFAYSDSSLRAMHAAVTTLSSDRLDRSFDMGMGTLRKTLVHVCDAEWWWLQNWTKGPDTPFPKADEKADIGKLNAKFDDIAARRDAILANMTDADLDRPIEVAPRPDLRRTFSIGVSMLQLCCHGTHHRAQGNNMLRRLGAEPLKLDYALWCKDH